VRIKLDSFYLMIIMFYHTVLFLYSYSCCYELENSHIDMFMTCVLVYSPCVMSISYMVMYGLFSIFVMCRLVYSLHIIHMLS
jgi:hypothetical protein